MFLLYNQEQGRFYLRGYLSLNISKSEERCNHLITTINNKYIQKPLLLAIISPDNTSPLPWWRAWATL